MRETAPQHRCRRLSLLDLFGGEVGFFFDLEAEGAAVTADFGFIHQFGVGGGDDEFTGHLTANDAGVLEIAAGLFE